MKKYLIILAFLSTVTFVNSFSQQADSKFDQNFKTIAGIYHENIIPYFSKFADGLVSPELDSNQKNALSLAFIKKFEAKEKYEVHQSLYNQLKKEDSVSPELLIKRFSNAYEFEFIGLDYEYFKKCEKESSDRLRSKH
jgi:hypothetical protein